MDEKDPFRTRDHVADFDGYVARYRSLSRLTRARLDHRCDVMFGERLGDRLDLFFPPNRSHPAPIHLFIHGGYWRMFDKEDFSFVADTVCAAGGIAAIMNYDLMPTVRMDVVVRQVRNCAKWLIENADRFGGDASRFTASGHSAGGHLSCFLITKDSRVRARSVLGLSGIYDLSPLLRSFLQGELNLTEIEVARFSPVSLNYQSAVRVELMVGQEETRPFHEQAEILRRVLLAKGCAVSVQTVPASNHMGIVAQLGDFDSIPAQALAAMVNST